jgi:O-antigen/teichoic acid export membrane protein
VYSAWILCLDTIAAVPFAALRLQRKAKLFAALKVLNIVVNVAANVVLLLVFHTGVNGIFLSGLIASASTVLFLLPVIARQFEWRFRPELFKIMIRFGIPYVPAGLASMMIQVVDRPILRALTDDATVGIYQANYRLGIFMMLMVSMYDYAWRPFFLLHANDPDAKTLFSRVLTYFVLVGTAVAVVLSLFIEDLVKIRVAGHSLINSEYWSGLPIVPVVLAAYLFLGIYNNLIAGIYIKEKSKYLPPITIVGALINVVANFLLIPHFGMMGAAIATLAAYAGMALTLYIVVRRFYPVEYEWGKIGVILMCGVGCYELYLHLPTVMHPLLWKLGLTVLFGVAMVGFGIIRIREVRSLLTGR